MRIWAIVVLVFALGVGVGLMRRERSAAQRTQALASARSHAAAAKAAFSSIPTHATALQAAHAFCQEFRLTEQNGLSPDEVSLAQESALYYAAQSRDLAETFEEMRQSDAVLRLAGAGLVQNGGSAP